MECNKDEALRAKDIAVRKFSERDYAGAKKFALKAQNLYPGLEGISQMITTLEVYVSAENKINGEMDMYGILAVTPLADDESIKKQYRKLVLQLHPDKNKFIGADGAFQLVSEAFNFLSDKAKRSAYNSRRNIKTSQQKVPSQCSAASRSAGSEQFQPKFPAHVKVSVPPFGAGRTADQKVPAKGGVQSGSRTDEKAKNRCSSSSQQKVPNQSGSSAVHSGVNGYNKHSSSTSSRGKMPKSGSQKASPSIQSFFKKEDTFWTMCTRCKMQYEYMRVYLNQSLKCPHCQVGFTAVEVPAPSNLSPVRPQQHQKPSSSSGPRMSGTNNLFGAASARWSPMFGTTYNSTSYNSSFNATSAQNTPSASAQAAGDHQRPTEKVNRESEEAKAAGKRERSDDPGIGLSREVPFKKTREMDVGAKCSWGGALGQSGIGNPDSGMGISPGQSIGNKGIARANNFPGFNSKVNNVNRELSSVEVRKMLTAKALSEIRKKVREWKKAKEARTAAKEKEKAKVKERQKSKLANDVAAQEAGNHTKSPVGDAKQEVEMVAMTVPDPDFHIFDSDRSESYFGDNQVWAAYDNDDGMPRFYAMIHEVISLDPFKVRLSWLNSKSNVEFGPLDWISRGFIKSCGDFWIGKHETNNLLNSFSHKVRWVKGHRGVIQIYPQKGEIWALYKNWAPDWNNDTPEDVVHAYDMVEVLDDYNEDLGVRVAPLVKAAGFLTVFCKQSYPKEVKRIPKEEMFRFSHQVPSYVLTGEEGPNAPKGCIELDPAATPSELLQVTAPGIKHHTGEQGQLLSR